MTYEITKELQKFIFAIFVLTILVVGFVVIIYSQVNVKLDASNVEMYNVYEIYKNCKNCVENYCINKQGNCEAKTKCQSFGLKDKVEICV